MNKNEIWMNILKELSPFQQKYFFLIFVPFILCISIFIPFNDYSGIIVKSQSSFLDVKAKILMDTFFFLTTFMSLYIFIKYKLMGISKELSHQVFKKINFVDVKQKEKDAGISLKNMSWFLYLVYFLMFIAMFFTPPSNSPKYYWIYGNGIFVTIVYSLFFYAVFVSYTLFIIWSHEIKNYLKEGIR
ncbi:MULTISPECIES: hypothetical protein [Acinetobacter]|uniref:Uncharacterized protein n=1 Tax=Acinetobacter junii SH205 TaxID=575587 RepID=D0SRR4_ACIJU|nr:MULTISPECIES: hypothetical protein [Acinetobacter]EEY91366.1 hypothetical protein HMPREF0026_03174 [Acinetobacter junii SH205]MBF9205482.1 hypothetical protein [Acinetobacter pittii]MCU4571711.1 hypothetical protein [Acinetobacter ursingii]MDU2409465.1 hypothetical protein [Acinetobacter junii]